MITFMKMINIAQDERHTANSAILLNDTHAEHQTDRDRRIMRAPHLGRYVVKKKNSDISANE